MLVPFEDLPESTRIWIYQADIELDSAQIDYINIEAAKFCNKWTAHNTALKTGFKVLHSKFLVLAVDEDFNQASGCSIDSSVRFIRSLGDHLGLNFFNRTQVAFLIDEQIYTTDLSMLKGEIGNGKILANTPTFNLQAKNVAEFQEQWIVPAQDSWMKRYF